MPHFRIPPLRHPGPMCDGTGRLYYVMYMTKPQYAAYRAKQKQLVRELRSKLRAHLKTAKADEIVNNLLRDGWSRQNTIPIQIVGERSSKKVNYVF